MPRNRYSVPNWCFLKPDKPADRYYAALAELGVDAVEMAAPEDWPSIRRQGLRILNIAGPGMQRGLNRTAHHPELLSGIRTCIGQAREAGVPHVIVFSGNRDGLSEDEGLAHCASALRELAPEAEAAGVTLVFEMLNRYDHADYQADRGAFGFALARAVQSPAVKVLYDVYHMFRMGDDVVGDIVSNLDVIAHLHVAGSPKRDAPGPDQEIDYARIVPAVRAAGYEGCWGLEFKPAGDPLDELKQTITLLDSYTA